MTLTRLALASLLPESKSFPSAAARRLHPVQRTKNRTHTFLNKQNNTLRELEMYLTYYGFVGTTHIRLPVCRHISQICWDVGSALIEGYRCSVHRAEASLRREAGCISEATRSFRGSTSQRRVVGSSSLSGGSFTPPSAVT